jgi:enamine deaminase RidA (YjgF/YER057c/UK114 family)
MPDPNRIHLLLILYTFMKQILLAALIVVTQAAYTQSPEVMLEKAGIRLPAITAPVASYVNSVRVGNTIYLSGKGPSQSDGTYIKGKLGKDLSIEEGKDAARLTGINQLAVLKAELKDLSKIKRIIKVNGYVNSTADFYDHPKVINGFSDLMIEIFGEKGRHARTALGVAVLPFNMAVEVEMIVEVFD